MPTDSASISFSGTGITVLGSGPFVGSASSPINNVDVNVAANATPGPRDIIITSGNQRVIATGAILILPKAQSADMQMTFTASTPGPVMIGQEDYLYRIG